MTITTGNRSAEMDTEKNESHGTVDSESIRPEALAEMNPAVKLHGWRLILTMPWYCEIFNITMVISN